MKELFNGMYNYKGYFGNDAHCQLEVFQSDDASKTLVIATELASNPGTSITNRAERLATEIVKQYNLFPLSLMWVEHYGPMSYNGAPADKDRYAFTSFTWNDNGIASNPQRSSTTIEQVEKLKASL